MAVTAQSTLPTNRGDFEIMTFSSGDDRFPHVVLYKKSSEVCPRVRIHSECMTGDVFGSMRCDCGDQLHYAMDHIQEHGGAILYLRQEGRGIGLTEKIKAYQLQDQGQDTIQANLSLGHEMDSRRYEIAVAILKSLGWNKIQLLTNNPDKVKQIEIGGIQIVKRIPIVTQSNPHNASYLHTKAEKMGHWLNRKED